MLDEIDDMKRRHKEIKKAITHYFLHLKLVHVLLIIDIVNILILFRFFVYNFAY